MQRFKTRVAGLTSYLDFWNANNEYAAYLDSCYFNVSISLPYPSNCGPGPLLSHACFRFVSGHIAE